MSQSVSVACRTRSKGVLVWSGLSMGPKRRKVNDHDDDLICLGENLQGESGSRKIESGFGASFSSREAMERGFEYLGESEDVPVEVVELDDGDDAEVGLGGCEKMVEVKEEKGEGRFDECGVRPDNPIVFMRDSDGFDAHLPSSKSDDVEKSDDEFKIYDDDENESECSSTEESGDDCVGDGERGGCKKMVRERVRNMVSESGSSGVWRRNGKRRDSEEVDEKEEEEKWNGVDCASATSSKSDKEETKKLGAREKVPFSRSYKKIQVNEKSDSEKEMHLLGNEMERLLQESEMADSPMAKKCGKNNANYCVNLEENEGNRHHYDKRSGVRSRSFWPKRQEKIGHSAKFVTRENVENGERDALHEILKVSSKTKNKAFQFFTECFWGKHDYAKDDTNKLEEKSDHVDKVQTQPIARREVVPLILDFTKKKIIEKSDSEKELDMLWAEMDMCLQAEEIGSKVDKARENEENSASQCKHKTIFKEDIGIYCIWCGWIETEIKYITEPFVDAERSARGVSLGGGKNLQFDGAMFNESGGDSEAVWSHNDGTVWDLIPDTKETLYPHQQEGFEFIWENLAGTTDLAKLKRVDPQGEGGCIISHAPGTGKTRLTMVFLQSYLQLFPKCLPVIIAPSNILLSWEDELRKWNVGIPFHNLNSSELSGKEEDINVVDWSGNQRQKSDAIRMLKLCSWYNEKKSILLISYNLYEKLAGGKSEGDEEKEKKNRKIKNQKKRARSREPIDSAMGKVLREFPGLLVLDEGHTPRNHRSCIWKGLSESRSQKRIILSGTPFQNNFVELYNVLCLMKPSFPDSIPQELKKFCRSKLKPERKASKDMSWEPVSSGNPADEKINQLKLLMNPFVHVHEGSVLQKKLPGLKDCLLVLKPDSLQQETLESIDGSQNVLNFEHKLALVSVHPSLFLKCSVSKKEESIVDKGKLERLRLDPYLGVKTKFLIEFVRLCCAVNEKVLIFSQFIDTLSLIKDQLQSTFNWSEGSEVLYMSGKVDRKQKQSLIHIFNDTNSQAKVLLATIKTSSEGINLIGASRVVLLDVVWNPSVERQAICRAYRLGQKKVVFTYHLLAQGTPECTKYCKQAEKNRLSELIFSSGNAEPDKLKSGVIFEDKVLDLMVQHENLKDMFAECRVQPRESNLETLGL
ncbi:hypothetical protein VNO78_16121 [Psophocarpus tetragonolobus]|uniref:Helicase C-terminal domain-containing protein n=1 Tax=Psophocarpus tetragonolobus TaxID=3891 RepID=A0AAN9SF98_PSOTE